eukprot:scaffold44731_cov48-Attheya_sp.AAC.2
MAHQQESKGSVSSLPNVLVLMTYYLAVRPSAGGSADPIEEISYDRRDHQASATVLCSRLPPLISHLWCRSAGGAYCSVIGLSC